MKNLFLMLYYFIAISCTSNKSNKNDYEVVSSPQGTQAVYVQNGNQSFWMDYILFNSLMNRGGIDNVNNYYRINHTTIINNQSKYQSLDNYRRYKKDIKNNNEEQVNNSNTNNRNKNNYTSPIRKSTSFYTSPIRNTPKSTYSSPIRTQTYSSPKTISTYSSPSRRK